MADLDTRSKRESSIGITLGFLRVLPNPDGDDASTSEERAHLAYNYSALSRITGVVTLDVSLTEGAVTIVKIDAVETLLKDILKT